MIAFGSVQFGAIRSTKFCEPQRGGKIPTDPETSCSARGLKARRAKFFSVFPAQQEFVPSSIGT
jgi:hypothetical protein